VPTPALLALSSVLPLNHHPDYADYTDGDQAGRILGGVLTIVELFQTVTNFIPHAGPLPQILCVTKELITTINQIQDNKDDCKHLVERIIRHMENIIEELTRMNAPLVAGTPTAARLYVLLSCVRGSLPSYPDNSAHICEFSRNIKAIRDDAIMWRDWSRLRRFWDRGAIKTGVLRHNQNLSDCFHSFSVGYHFSLFSRNAKSPSDCIHGFQLIHNVSLV
jgi:hypothetical protein